MTEFFELAKSICKFCPATHKWSYRYDEDDDHVAVVDETGKRVFPNVGYPCRGSVIVQFSGVEENLPTQIFTIFKRGQYLHIDHRLTPNSAVTG